jgi:hypothetical protein
MTASTDETARLKSPPSDRAETAAGRLPPPILSAERLAGTVKPVASLAGAERDAMLRLMTASYHNVDRCSFERDLAEKEWAILLHEREQGKLQGFSTLMRLEETVEGQPLTAFFSGDTVISRPFWGETVLPRLWGRLVFSLAEEVRNRPVYWFLICSGYKTYRFLPVFFRSFYPGHGQDNATALRPIIEVLARRKFPEEFDAAQGVVRLRRATPLKPGVADVTAQRLRDPHIAFFQRTNPGHILGDELACLAQVSHDNLTAAGRRMLGLK